MTNDDEFYSWPSLSDMLLGKKTPAQLECALEEEGWFYKNERGHIKALDPTGLARALDLLSTYYRDQQESETYPYDRQPPSDWLNTDCDPGLVRFRQNPNTLSKNRSKNSQSFNLQNIPGKMPHIAIGNLAVEIAWQIEQESGMRASARKVMNELYKKADAGDRSDFLMSSNRDKKEVIWMTSKAAPKAYGIEACQKTLSNWYKSRQ